jgi:Kef-type K+ transport system membrane component KefB
MKRIIFLMGFLVVGLVCSQLVPNLIGDYPPWFVMFRQFLTMGLLAFIMIEVGREFEIDLKNKKQYAMDYLVAATAAAFPWILVSAYFFLFLMPEVSSTGKPQWIEALLAGRFAAPTSAGVLFSMLAAAGLSGTWVFRKTRILAIFDDLDTVLLMIPLQILMVGLVWQLGGVLAAIAAILFLGLKFYKRLNWPTSWPWIASYALIMTAISEGLYFYSKDPVTHVGLHIEILLPAFALGCALKLRPHEHVNIPGEDDRGFEAEEIAGLLVSCVFLFLVGFSMPSMIGTNSQDFSSMGIGSILFHVLAVTFLSNLGKMFACFCYKAEASFRERLAISVALFPRGEVGAGVLAVALGYGMAGPFITVAFLSLAFNLLLTGLFILVVKKLISNGEVS